MTRKLKLAAMVLGFLIAAMPLMADNQVVSSQRVTSLEEENAASQTSLWQSYEEQLGLTMPDQIDLDYLQEMRLMEARGDINYMVTVGDIYQLAYTYNNQPVTLSLEVTHSPSVPVPSIGSFDRTGRTFTEFKNEVEAAILARYPYSNPNLTMIATGAFPVHVSGYVDSSQTVSAWALDSLSDMAYYASDNASTRDVTVISADGFESHYDLYKAKREGDLSQDPFLRPGDRIIFNQKETTVLVNGAVMRSGTYQILDGETLADVISGYALGLSRQADAGRISVTRYENGTYSEYNVALDDSSFALRDGDSIRVYSLDYPVGSVTLEGALQSSDSSAGTNSIAGQVSTQYFFRFLAGDTVEDMLVQMSPYFTASSDLDGCYLTRGGKSYPVSFRDVLYGNDPAGDMVLQNGDRFTIPFSNQIVTVNGAVNSPGTYAFVPGKDVTYYVNLAGGLSSEAKGLEKYKLYNSYGERIDDSSPITAETTIEMERSTFERDLGIAISVIGVVSTVTTIILNIIDIAASGN